MRHLLAAAILLVTTGSQPWKGRFVCEEQPATLILDLYEESIEVPDMEVLGPMNGYLSGKGIYCTWMVVSHQIMDETHATMRISNDLGSEVQAVELTLQGDSLLTFQQVDGNVIKRVDGKKLVKIPQRLIFKRVE